MKRKEIVKQRGEKWWALIISTFFLLFYVFFQSSSIYGGDAGDLVTAAYVGGVPHPPGYPLYTFLGWILTHIPFSTISWRVTLLSSIPQAASLGIMFLIINNYIKNKLISLISVTTLGFSYLYWLYAMVPEVFALNILFAVLILYCLIIYRENEKRRLLYISCFLLGLSLTHHHTILLLLPGYLWLIWPNLKRIYQNKIILIKCILLFLLGLIPYIYVVFAAQGNPIVNWEDPKTLSGFIRLVSRAMYGTFRSQSGAGQAFIQRILNLKIAIETMWIDFTYAGLILAILGITYQYNKNKNDFWLICLGFLFSGPLFLFYASFPVLLNFHLGTQERFLLLPYIFLCIWIAYGISMLSSFINSRLRKINSNLLIKSEIIFILFPLVLFITNYPKIAPLKNDRTVENYAYDLLKTIPDNAILLSVDDTSTFNLLYIYSISGGERNNRGIKFFQYSLTDTSFYQNVIIKQYPDLNLQKIYNRNSQKIFLANMADAIFDKYPIFSTSKIKIGSENYGWLPYGLLFKMYKYPNPRITNDEYKTMVEPIFNAYQNPLSGALGKYKHVMLSDVLREYSNAHLEAGKEYLNTLDLPFAEKHLLKARIYQQDNTKILLKLTELYTLAKKCQTADEVLEDALKIAPNNPEIYRLYTDLYENCYKDKVRVEEYRKLYQNKLNKSQTQLNNF